jgi:hypothetical protein
MSDEVARSIDLRDTAANISYISFESPQRVPFPLWVKSRHRAE